jgi:aryl-alcohol dehydrogenase-like predicted oxidoreductase
VHCYFHLVHAHERILDETGIEVSDLDAAHYQAMKAIQELRQEGEADAVDWSGWQLEVADEAGRILLSIPLDLTQH